MPRLPFPRRQGPIPWQAHCQRSRPSRPFDPWRPSPATSDSRFTSLGLTSIDRFLRRVCNQGFPDQWLPEALREANLQDDPRLVKSPWASTSGSSLDTGSAARLVQFQVQEKTGVDLMALRFSLGKSISGCGNEPHASPCGPAMPREGVRRQLAEWRDALVGPVWRGVLTRDPACHFMHGAIPFRRWPPGMRSRARVSWRWFRTCAANTNTHVQA
ncbi:hypothetical protein EZM97_11715 [Dyella soli]|uniref:Uncharacterized protein n=1 Tax=Dyella soli TaxID=522319 RepID=A0A4R0YP35_9GAMM|nr:hypothetical protein EZM97_11715 [Dyella soli]